MTAGTIRTLCEQYQALGLVALPADRKRAVSYVLDDDGNIVYNRDGTPERWKSFQVRFPTAAEMDAAEWHRATGVVLIVGPAIWEQWPYLWVLDIEAEHRADGERWLDANVPDWRAGVVVQTGGGGLHVYALHSSPVPTDSKIPWGEIRGRAAICVLPPSIHPETKKPYRWLSETWTNLPAIDPATVPGATPKQSGEVFNERGWVAEWLRTPIAAGAGRRAPDGIPKMIGHLIAKNIDRETAVAILEQWDARNPEPLGAAEIRRHVESMYGRYPSPGEPPKLVLNGHDRSESPSIVTASALLRTVLPEPRVIVDGVLLEGASILAGRPKLGKSWLCLGLAIAVAAGGMALGSTPVDAGDVLYLSLEDGRRRLQSRIRMMLGNDPPPERLHLATSWRRSDDGGLEDLERWLLDHPGARLVLIDTLKRFRPGDDGKKRIYDVDYEAVAPLTKLAERYNVAIIIVHHTRKMDSSDPLDLISGSTGLTGAVDGAMVLKRERGRADAVLHVTHRDSDDQALGLVMDPKLGGWRLAGNAIDLRRSKERQEILDLLAKATGPLRPIQIARMLGRDAGAIRRLLPKMLSDSELTWNNGYYSSLIPHNSGNSGNGSNSGNTGNTGNAAAQEPLPLVTGSGNSPVTVFSADGHGKQTTVTGVTGVTTNGQGA